MKGNGNFDLAFGGKATSMIVDKLGEDASRKEAAKMHNQAVDNYKRVLDSKVQKGLEEAEAATKKMDFFIPIREFFIVAIAAIASIVPIAAIYNSYSHCSSTRAVRAGR